MPRKKYKNVWSEGKCQSRSREIMEEHLSRKLKPNEVVHHINEDTLDNRIENLQVMTRGEHQRHHLWKGGKEASLERGREARRKDSKEYYQKNKERILIKMKEYYQKNKERIKTRQSAYHKRKKGEAQ